MVPGAQRADLFDAAVDGPFADHGRVGALHGTARLGHLQVLGPAEAALDAPARPLLDDLAELGAGQLQETPGSHPGGNPLVEPVHEVFQPRLHLVENQVRDDQAHAAVDVEPDAPRRDDALVGVHGRHAPDGEAVPGVAVGHAQGVLDDARQGGHVADLLEDGCVHFPDELFRAVDPRGDAHAPLEGRRQLPDCIGVLLQLTGNAHGSPWSGPILRVDRPGGSISSFLPL